MFCHNCGREISGEAKYCPMCGATQPGNSPQVGGATSQYPTTPPSTFEVCEYVGCGAVAKHKCASCGKLFCIKHIAAPMSMGYSATNWTCIYCAEKQYKKYKKLSRSWGWVCLVSILLLILWWFWMATGLYDSGIFLNTLGIIFGVTGGFGLLIGFTGWFICLAVYKGTQNLIKGNFPDLKL